MKDEIEMQNYIIMKSKRDGVCSHCGSEFLKGENFKWEFNQRLGYCVDCPTVSKDVERRKDIANVAVKTNEVEPQVMPDLVKLFDGRFTVPFQIQNSEKKRHITLWITTRSKKHEHAGYRRIRVLHRGNDNDKNWSYVDVAEISTQGFLLYDKNFLNDPTFSGIKAKAVKEAMKLLIEGEGQAEFGIYYSMLSRRCWKCNKVLTNPDTLKLPSHCGPICHRYMAERGLQMNMTEEPQTRIFKL